mgnify:CR=1 FL=1
MMAESLLYKLHSHQQRPGVAADPTLFREAYTSRFNKVRIFKVLKVSKTSKQWTRDPANRICDAPGSWYCVGQYPPALRELISRRIDFAQLEDFNKQRGGDADGGAQTPEKVSGSRQCQPHAAPHALRDLRTRSCVTEITNVLIYGACSGRSPRLWWHLASQSF